MSNTILDLTQASNGVYVSKWRIPPKVIVKGAIYKVISPGVLNDEFIPSEHPEYHPENTSKEEGAIYDIHAGRIIQKIPGFKNIAIDINKRTIDEIVGRRARILGETQIGELSPEQKYTRDIEETGKSLDVTI